jgi:uncharacterized protein YPO0396
LQKEISDLESEIEKAKEDIALQEEKNRNKIESFSSNYSPDQKGLNKIKGELDEKVGKKQREKNPAVAEQADAFIKELDNIKNLDTFLSKTKGEKENIEKRIRSIKSEIEQKNKEKGKSSTDNSTSQSQKGSGLRDVLPHTKAENNKPVTGQTQELQVPNNPHLPKTGILYQGDGKNYLAIKDWDEFDAAQDEAKRLNAILCAERS